MRSYEDFQKLSDEWTEHIKVKSVYNHWIFWYVDVFSLCHIFHMRLGVK